MNFKLGLNYWASNAGCNMWHDFDAGTVARDMDAIAKAGVDTLRVFPIWPDFQPATPMLSGGGGVRELRRPDGTEFDDPYYLDSAALDNFGIMCREAARHGIGLIVGLITGWMSGRLYVPPALYGKNVYEDPLALLLQQKFIKGFVGRFRGERAIVAWDLGNECNCMCGATRNSAESWTNVIANAIRAVDPSRPIVSGMHSIRFENEWTIMGQAEACDVLTTHPYAYFVPHCRSEKLLSYKTLCHATAESVMYSSVGGKPCLVEEIGTLGPGVCGEREAADFLRVNLWSSYSHGLAGLLWWCAFEQSHLTEPPYGYNMVERELGFMLRDGSPKEFTRGLNDFHAAVGEMRESLRAAVPELAQDDGAELLAHAVDAVCVLTSGQDQWAAAYGAFMLAKRAGLTIAFAWCGGELPDAKAYIVPSVHGCGAMEKRVWDDLLGRAARGATLLVTDGGAFLTGFRGAFGLEIADSRESAHRTSFELGGAKLSVSADFERTYRVFDAEVLASDEAGTPVFTRVSRGAGEVYWLGFPAETFAADDGEAMGLSEVYARAFGRAAAERVITVTGAELSHTRHPFKTESGAEGELAVILNLSGAERAAKFTVPDVYRVSAVYGDPEKIAPYGACVLCAAKTRA